MKTTARILLWLVAGLILVLAPWFARAILLNYDERAYTPPDLPAASMAATPVPTATPVPLSTRSALVEAEFRAGPVVVDLAHLNRLNRSSFQPLAAALADQNVGLRFWLPKSELDTFDLQNFLDFPDQSDRLATQLADASAFVVVSPFFLWSQQEIALIEQFVADGGRLLLISDPDITGDVARDINNLAEPFGVVFNEDYLYDTELNDGNHTHIFLGEFAGRAAELDGQQIALYGARSISGATAPQASSRATTLSSVRPGISGFTTIALAGTEARNTAGRVLVMSDFDVLTTPYVDRHDNRALVDFVAEFLAAAQFAPTVVDFPAYFGKEVRLLYGTEGALGATLVAEGARLQDRLTETGRSLTLAAQDALAALTTDESEATDLIYLADFKSAEADAGLLTGLGLALVEETMPAKEAPPPAEATVENGATPARSEGATTRTLAATSTITATTAVTATAPVTTAGSPTDTAAASRTPVPTFTPTPAATPTATPTPAVTLYLETEGGLRFLADETLFIALNQDSGDPVLLVLLAPDESGIKAGIERLLTRDFRDCIREELRTLCPLEAPESSATPTPAATGAATAPASPQPDATASPQATPIPGLPSIPEAPENAILLIDDNDGAKEGEVSEADLYIKALASQGLAPDLWQTESRGTPTADELKAYRWVIWSGAGYAISGPGVQDLALLFDYTNAGGRITISSRQPSLGQAPGEPEPIRDLTVDAEGQALIKDFPTETIELAEELPPVYPLSETFLETVEISVALRRGPASAYAEAPVLMFYSDEAAPEPQGAQIAIMGMALNWLPDDVQQTLVRNMTEWQLAE